MSRCAMLMPEMAEMLIAAACCLRFAKNVVDIDTIDENDKGRRWGGATGQGLKKSYVELSTSELDAIAEGQAKEILSEIYPGYHYWVAANVCCHHEDVVEVRICAECYL